MKKQVSNVIAVIHFFISFFSDQLIFEGVDDTNWGFFVFAKIIYLFVLLCIWKFIFSVIHGGVARRICLNAIPFAIFVIIGMVCIYPAIQFGGDMPYFFRNTIYYNYTGSLHWLSSMFYIVAMMLIPTTGGPTILMGVYTIISVGYVITLFEKFWRNKWIIRFLFCIPTMVFYGLFPNRLPMMTNLFLVYFAILFHDYLVERQYSWRHVIFLIVIGGILSVWRIECLSLIVMAPLLMLTAQKDSFSIKKYGIYFGLILLMHMALSLPGKITSTDSGIYAKLYPFANYSLPIMKMSGLDIHEDYSEEYGIINQYLDMQKLENSVTENPEAFWKSDQIGEDMLCDNATISAEEYTKTVLGIIRKEPWVYLKSRFEVFDRVTRNEYGFAGNWGKDDGSYSALRVLWLEVFGGTSDGSFFANRGAIGTIINIWMKIKVIFWNYYWVILTVLFAAFISWKNKNAFLATCVMEILIYSLVVFLLAPAAVFKYYWPCYVFAMLLWTSKILFEKRLNGTYLEEPLVGNE